MRQYLVEGATGAFPFIVDRSRPFVSEARQGGVSITRIPGRFSICDAVNGNNRRYSRQVWEKNLAEDSALMLSIKRNSAFGMLEHPKDGQISLLSPISHLVTDAKLTKTTDAAGKEIAEVHGEIALVGTDEGKKLTALIEAGYNPLVSSRGYGSLVKGSDGVDDVQPDYVCESWDVVMKPSFDNAELMPERKEDKPMKEAVTEVRTVTEDQKPISAPGSAAESATAAPASVTEQKTQVPQPPMITLNELKSKVQGLRAMDTTKLDPAGFAEGMGLMESVHQDIADYAAEDPKRSWDSQKLHEEVKAIAQQWVEAAMAPARKAAKLQEDNNKLLAVVGTVTKTAMTYKGKLTEATKGIEKQSKLIESLTQRGQTLLTRGRGWMRVAESRKQNAEALTEHFDTACDTADIVAAQYHADTTELGRRIIELEFGEAAQTPEVKKALQEATKLRDITKIREDLTKQAKGEPTEEGKEGKEGQGEPAKPVTEAKEQPKEAPKAGDKKPVTEAKQQPKKSEVVVEASAKPLTVAAVNESVALVRRLSTAAPAK
jgi:hypothetical protein